MRNPNPGAWLRKKRKECNLTQKQLSAETGLSVRTIRRIENNDLHMSYKKYLALVDYFHVSFDEMLYGEQELD